MVKVLCKGGRYYQPAFESADPDDWPKGDKEKYYFCGAGRHRAMREQAMSNPYSDPHCEICGVGEVIREPNGTSLCSNWRCKNGLGVPPQWNEVIKLNNAMQMGMLGDILEEGANNGEKDG